MNQLGVIIHIYMEISQGNFCVATFISNKQNVFYLFFFSTKSENRRAEQVLPGGGMLVPLGRGRWQGKEGECGAKNVYTCI
jgi:hypothetical protein